MKLLMRRYGVQFIAVVGLIAISLAVSWVIVQNQRLRVPLLEERPFELKAEFETAQAVAPGQGQTIRVAGVTVGDVAEVELVDGVAEVTFEVNRDYLPVYRDATILMRPATGLKDMFFSLDPGTEDAGVIEEGGAVPLANTAPDVNVDEILAGLDADSRAYLRLLVSGLGQGLDGRSEEIGGALAELGPINRDLKAVNSGLAARDEELARLVHNLNVLSIEVAGHDRQLGELIGASDEALGALASQAPDLTRLTAELPGTLAVGRRTLTALEPFATDLGPSLDSLRPFARRLDGVARATTELAGRATPVVRDDLRPLVRAARPVVPDLRTAATNLSTATPRLNSALEEVNRLGNMAAFNPNGAEAAGTSGRNEGFLYWLGWFSHNGPSIWSGQDAHGPFRRLYLTGGCSELLNVVQNSPFGPIVGGITTGLGPLFSPGGVCG